MDKLRDMELFALTAREESFTRAAKAAGISPASVSRRIAELEAQLGVQLISRTTRSVTLTEAGSLYYARVQRILEELADADEAASALQQKPHGALRVHSRTLFGLLVAGPLIPKFQAIYPDIRLELTLSERQIRLREEEFDLDLRFGAPQDPSVVRRRVLASERILVASPHYLEIRPPLEKPADLAGHACLGYLIGHEPIVWRFMVEGRLEELVVPAGLSVDNGELLRRLAIAGHGIALLDDFTVRREIEDGRLVRLLPHCRVTNTTFEGGIYAVYKETAYLPQKIRVFIDFLVENAARPPALA